MIRYGHYKFRRRVLAVLCGTLIALALLDVSVGWVFRVPAGSQTNLSNWQRYFDYGRSIEGKLRMMVGRSAQNDAPIVSAGWLARDCDVATSLEKGRFAFDIYGMSFSEQIAEQMLELDPSLTAHSFAGPAAPPNHSYACYSRRIQAGLAHAPVQILAMLSSSVPRMLTVTGLTTSFEGPEPFTYPRYTLGVEGKLVPYMPSIVNAEDLREALADPARWNKFKQELSAHDAFFDDIVFGADVLDRSVVGRMMRRAWGQRTVGVRTAGLRAKDGYSGAPEIVAVLRAMVIDFADTARRAGAQPIVILIEDRGNGGTLTNPLAPTLQDHRIAFVSTSSLVSSDDPRNFLSDGHFTPAVNREIAGAVLTLLGRPRQVAD